MNKLNRNKQDVNSYVNSNDLSRYLAFLQFDNPFVFRQSEITSIDTLFMGNNSLAIILLNDDDPSGIGHYVVLRKDTEWDYTYFDCLADPIPDELRAKFNPDVEHHVTFLTKPLMGPKNNICGKYCIAFALAGNIHIDLFTNLLQTNPNYSPDYIITNLYRIDYSDNILQ